MGHSWKKEVTLGKKGLHLETRVLLGKKSHQYACITKRTLRSLDTANLSWQTCVGKLKLVCVNGTKTVGKHWQAVGDK